MKKRRKDDLIYIYMYNNIDRNERNNIKKKEVIANTKILMNTFLTIISI